jgi:hypothetical protein
MIPIVSHEIGIVNRSFVDTSEKAGGVWSGVVPDILELWRYLRGAAWEGLNTGRWNLKVIGQS